MKRLDKLVLTLIAVAVILASPALVFGQQILRLENQSYAAKGSFLRGEQIFVVIVVPFNTDISILVHYPPNSPGPSPKTFISSAPVPANVESRLGPIILEPNAPCGKYQIEVVVNPPGGQRLYTFFDYATNEPPCVAISPPPTPPPAPADVWVLTAAVFAAVAVVAAVALFLTRRRVAAPPKAPAVPVSPPAIPPTTTTGPPKQGPRMSPQVRRIEEDRGE